MESVVEQPAAAVPALLMGVIHCSFPSLDPAVASRVLVVSIVVLHCCRRGDLTAADAMRVVRPPAPPPEPLAGRSPARAARAVPRHAARHHSTAGKHAAMK